MVRVGMVSLGCSKNQVDAERMLFKISEAGYQLVGDAALADVVIINTCGFIESAKQEAIDTILEFGVLKKEGRIKKIIVTGCLAQRYRDEILAEIPEADAVIGIGKNDEICRVIEQVLSDKTISDYPPVNALSLTGGRIQTTLSFYSYLKIAEGCSNCCSYCSIPQIRGPYRSVPMEALLSEAEELAVNGVRELIVIAQDTTRYGEDIYGKPMLPRLLEKLCAIPQLKWIRVLYCYPERITDELISVIANEDKIVKYLDIPIQHCNGHILRAMNRKGDESSLRLLIEKLRREIPGVVLRTTLITGFPGETESEFDRLAEFVREVRFDRLGCFAYSCEENTSAADMDGQVPDDVKQKRADIIMEQQSYIMNAKNELLRGKDIEVLVEGYDRYGECYFGRSAADAPDIDGKVFFTSKNRRLVPGIFVNVHITDIMDYDLIGDVTDEPAK